MKKRPRRKRTRRRNPPGYRALHWGDGGGRRFEADVPDAGDNTELVVLGKLAEITYRTTKGGESADWTHDFEGRLPLLCVGKEDGRLYVVGGSYRVTERGIVG